MLVGWKGQMNASGRRAKPMLVGISIRNFRIRMRICAYIWVIGCAPRAKQITEHQNSISNDDHPLDTHIDCLYDCNMSQYSSNLCKKFLQSSFHLFPNSYDIRQDRRLWICKRKQLETRLILTVFYLNLRLNWRVELKKALLNLVWCNHLSFPRFLIDPSFCCYRITLFFHYSLPFVSLYPSDSSDSCLSSACKTNLI